MAMFIPGSVRFNIDTPTWELAPDTRTLHFASPVSAGTTITYRYSKTPYILIASPVSLISRSELQDNDLAFAGNGKVCYQVREWIQELMKEDRSYWGR
jgi:hypothetical protein